MRIQAIILTILLTLFSSVALAGSGHSHAPVTQQQAEQTASQIVANLASKGSIEESWSSTKVEKSEQKQFGNNQEWVIHFKNDTASDPEKATLYIFLTLSGEYIAANYTGD